MAEDVARAVGAGGPDVIKVAGKECTVSPLNIKELTELERDCLSRYRRSYVQAYAENIDLLPKEEREGLLRQKLEEASKFELSDLPTRFVYDPKRVKVTPSLQQWLETNMDGFEATDKAKKDTVVQRAAAMALDSGLLSDGLYENLTGMPPKKTRTSYIGWWSTGTIEGMVTMVYLIVKRSGVTRDQVETELSDNPNLLTQISREIENLSAPSVGNG